MTLLAILGPNDLQPSWGRTCHLFTDPINIYLIAKPKFKLAPKANAFGDVWEFAQEMNNEHPAAFPVDLIARIISSTTGKVVLDPFMGSGTTAIAARALERDYIGIDISPEYCAMAQERLDRDLVRKEIVITKQRSLFPVPNENLYKGRIN